MRDTGQETLDILNIGKMGRKKRFCNTHGLLHFPPTGKKCPGPKHCNLGLEYIIRRIMPKDKPVLNGTQTNVLVKMNKKFLNCKIDVNVFQWYT